MILRHHDFGGSGPLLVFLHANGFPGQVFLPIAMRGLTVRFRCIALDLPGHGDAEQDLTPGRLQAAALVEATFEYLDRLGFKGECMKRA